ncbi:MAG: FAD-dependent oxidoreductase, partial [Verrucomicrobiae bacterium]|nr:FAD-dependent oxidoreductase [Verrucomicrobiae bacterium]
MSDTHFDFLVIGGGSAGYAAARTAREVVERVAIVDGSKELGGLCILRGCMPSKTVIYSAEVLHLAQKGKLFGLDIKNAKMDMPLLHQRKVDTIREFSDYRVESLESDRFTL